MHLLVFITTFEDFFPIPLRPTVCTILTLANFSIPFSSDAAHLTNGPKSALHGEAENESFLMGSHSIANEIGAANNNNSNVNPNVTDVNSNDINGINGVNGFHE